MIFWLTAICLLVLFKSRQLSKAISETFTAVGGSTDAIEFKNRIWWVQAMLVINISSGFPAGLVFVLALWWGSVPFAYIVASFLALLIWMAVPLIRFLTPRRIGERSKPTSLENNAPISFNNAPASKNKAAASSNLNNASLNKAPASSSLGVSNAGGVQE
jgi:hypothetical protein